jgi:hypothetical protein
MKPYLKNNELYFFAVPEMLRISILSPEDSNCASSQQGKVAEYRVSVVTIYLYSGGVNWVRQFLRS